MKPAVFILIFFLTAFAQHTNSQVCADPLNIIYGVKKNGDVVPVNVNTATIGSPLTSSSDAGYPGTTRSANAIGLKIQTQTFYFFQNNIQSTQKFVSFNTNTNTYQTLANSPIKGSVVKGCISADGTGYYCIDSASTLCYYNIAANTWSAITSNIFDQFHHSLNSTFSTLGNGDMVIDGLGNLWIVAASSTNFGLYKINAPLPTSPLASLTLQEMVPPSQSNPSGLPFVGIAYDPTGDIYLSTVNDLYLLQTNMSLVHINTFNVTGVNVDLTSCNFPFFVLPLTIKNFNACLKNNNIALLKWSVDQQINAQGYNIERSDDGLSWNSIGFVPVSNGFSGNDYQFQDFYPADGTNYYRIRTSLVGGNDIYSTVQNINIKNLSVKKVWPTTTSSFINIQLPDSAGNNNAYVSIVNSSGQKAMNSKLHGGINKLYLNNLSPGYYIVHVLLSTGEAFNSRIIKQ